MDIVEKLRRQADADDQAGTLYSHVVGREAATEIEQLRTLARDAYEAWDNDRDAKVGKLLRAMLDETFRKTYRPDLSPKLWAMLIPGPYDVWAMPSKEAAEEAAVKHNKAIETGLLAERFCVPKESVQARVIEWPYGAEEHAKAMESGEPEVFDGYQSDLQAAAGGMTQTAIER